MHKIIKNSDNIELTKVKFPPKQQLSADKGWFSSLRLDPKANIPQYKIIHIEKLYKKQSVVLHVLQKFPVVLEAETL
jgi:hypothetical protein